MIRIRKDLSKIPKSLYVPISDNDPNATEQSKKTHLARLSVIQEKSYTKGIKKIGEKENKGLYSKKDVKSILFEIYQSKCAFCEQWLIDNNTVEHFRPKSKKENALNDNDSIGYYWLSFSWDNLILSCEQCNKPKDDKFKINKSKAVYEENKLIEVNTISQEYNMSEEPMLIHPEYEDPEPQIYFDKNGVILPKNDRAEYTIKACEIDRPKLNDARLKVLKDFEDNINDLVKQNQNYSELIILLKDRVEQFISRKQPFLAFRRYALKNFLNEKLKNIYVKNTNRNPSL